MPESAHYNSYGRPPELSSLNADDHTPTEETDPMASHEQHTKQAHYFRGLAEANDDPAAAEKLL